MSEVKKETAAEKKEAAAEKKKGPSFEETASAALVKLISGESFTEEEKQSLIGALGPQEPIPVAEDDDGTNDDEEVDK